MTYTNIAETPMGGRVPSSISKSQEPGAAETQSLVSEQIIRVHRQLDLLERLLEENLEKTANVVNNLETRVGVIINRVAHYTDAL